MASRDLNELSGPARAKAEAMLNACKAAGVDVLVTCTYRSDAEQAALYIQGRAPLAVVNDLRAKVGLSAIAEEENGRKVTNARPGQSFHARRMAIDVAPIIAGKPVWNPEHPVWQTVGKIGRSCGLEWGGDWTHFREYPHFQDSIAELPA
jgi:peptidoglycan L-alanyl-D-glutamate endopeptidase CwlK